MPPVQQNLLGLGEEELCAFVDSLGERRFRGRQIFGWLYAKGAAEFRAMTDLGKELRERLEVAATIRGIALRQTQQSQIDGTTKFLFGLADGLEIESVLIPPRASFRPESVVDDEEQTKHTVCVSTQVGCPLDCRFCATGAMGYSRNLTAGEIIDQLLQIRRATGKRITNVVFMGMGEPMMNYRQVMAAAEIMTAGAGIAARHITVSTAGWAEQIRRMGEEKRRMKLAVSLHSAVEKTRLALMPVTRKFGLRTLLAAIEDYYKRTRLRVTYEAIFFDGVNDSDAEVAALTRFARHVPSKINVIPFHPISVAGISREAATLRPSPRMEGIVEELRAAHLTVMVRSNAGEDLLAACGQLAIRSAQRGEPRDPASPPVSKQTAHPVDA